MLTRLLIRSGRFHRALHQSGGIKVLSVHTRQFATTPYRFDKKDDKKDDKKNPFENMDEVPMWMKAVSVLGAVIIVPYVIEAMRGNSAFRF